NSEHQAIVVAFRDENGQPYRQTGYLYSRIALSTSNTQVGEISSTSFTAKETYALAKFKTNYVVGETTLTASLEGHQPSQTLLTVDGSGPAAVMLTQIPSIIEANNFGAESLAINLVDHYGKPVAAQKDTLVYLSSSDPEITRVDASATIPAGESHVTAKAYTTLRWGQTTITGAADGLGSGSLNFRTVGFTGSISEYHLGLYTIPKIPADGREYEGVVVQLQDQSGLPVLAKSDIDVSLSSSSTRGLVQEHIVIPAGQSLVTATIRTTLEDSTFKITASSQGYTSVEAEIESTLQPLSIFRASEFPSRADYGTDILVAVDVYSGDIPVRDATVTVTGNSAKDMIVITDEFGHAEGLYVPTLPGSNSIVVRVNKPGYEEETLTSRISLIHTVNVVINAESEGGNEMAAQLKIEGPSGTKNQNTKPGSPIKYDNSNWGVYKITAPPQVKATNAVYNFVGWSDGATENPRSWTVSEDTQITAVYNASYLVQISDPNGMARGSGYYDEGTNARISLSQETIGGILVDKSFAGWSGDIRSSSATTDVLVDGPKTIKAEWSDGYLKIALIIAAAAGGGFYYYWKIFKPKKEIEARQRAPDLDWYKS
ncbi:MAG: hypothetical protein MN733_10845, partial [Nitrososphaera sp.]|nr:hypothetical protein [Nitrososphaera sp.]